jgi:predicted amidohydrolase YtcJ
MILTGGVIRTMDPGRPMADSLAIEGGRIVERAGGERIDLDGRCVVPGFTDSHTHFPTWALMRHKLRLEDCASLAEAVERVGAAAAGTPAGRWLIGYGWRGAGWEREPHSADLDAVVGDVPTALWAKDSHTLWLSSAALGRPGGVLREAAAWEFRDRHLRVPAEEYVEAMLEAIPVAHARGVTAVHDKDGWLGALGLWQRVRARDGLTLRVWQSLPYERLDELERLGIASGLGDGFLRAGYLKLFMDGTLGSGTATMLSGGGIELTSREELETVVRRAARAGWPVAVHAIGDRANRDALAAFDATRAEWEPRGLRQRIEHAQHLHPSDAARFGALGVAVSAQFSHALSDCDLVDAQLPEEAVRSYAFRSLWDEGAVIANGSDAPIEELDPIAGIAAGVRRSLDDRPPWRPHEALTAEEALRATTVNPAWLCGDEHRRGMLVPGHDADLVVLDRDPVTCPPEELAAIEVIATMVSGRWVYRGSEPPPARDRAAASRVAQPGTR